MAENDGNSRLKWIAEMSLGDLTALQAQGLGETPVIDSTGSPQGQAKTTTEAEDSNPRLSHLTRMKPSDIKNLEFEEAAASGATPSTYDLSG